MQRLELFFSTQFNFFSLFLSCSRNKEKAMTEKLGERALQAMKEMNTAVVEFKVPMAPTTRKGQMKILTEEQYIEVNCAYFLGNNNSHSNYIRFFNIL